MTDDTSFTHTDDDGEAQMVDVGEKPPVDRRAVATGVIQLSEGTLAAIEAEDLEKGDVLGTARIGAIQAAKHTWETIPLCHQIPLSNVSVDFDREPDQLRCTVAVETTARTGCEMEAIQAVTTGLGVVWDMVKAAEKDEDGQYPGTAITDVHVREKVKDD